MGLCRAIFYPFAGDKRSRMNVASIRLTHTKNEWNLITRVWTFYYSCFDNLSRETYAKHIVGPSIVVARKP